MLPSGSFDDVQIEVLVLPVADADAAIREADAAPVVGWFRALAAWVGQGRSFGSGDQARLSSQDAEQVAGLLGMERFEPEDSDARASLCDVAVRWALQSRLLTLRTGVLRVASRNAAWLKVPEVLWFRALSALQRPDLAFTDLLGEYGGTWIGWYEPIQPVGRFLRSLAAGPLDDDALVGTFASRHGTDTDAEVARRVGEARALTLLTEALGLIGREETETTETTEATETADRAPSGGRRQLTALGRAVHALIEMPYAEVADQDDEFADLCLLRQPDGQIEPGFQVKVTLSGAKVWRRLLVPGELTMHGLHLAIQSSFGWSNDRLHVFEAGPFKFSSGSGWRRLDGAIPTEFPTMSDLRALGIRELRYTYHLGDSRVLEIVVGAEAPKGVAAVECLAGAGIGGRGFDLARINGDLARLFETG